METQNPDTTPSSGAPTDSANSKPSKPGKADKPKGNPKKPRHSATNQLNDFYALRDEARLVDDPLVKADLAQANEAAAALEKETKAMPAIKEAVANARSERQATLSEVEVYVTLVKTALPLCPNGQEIIDACKDSKVLVFAEALVRRVPAETLGPNQHLMVELGKRFRHYRHCEGLVGDKQAALDQAGARFSAASKRLKGCASQLRSSLRYHATRQRVSGQAA